MRYLAYVKRDHHEQIFERSRLHGGDAHTNRNGTITFTGISSFDSSLIGSLLPPERM